MFLSQIVDLEIMKTHFFQEEGDVHVQCYIQ